MCLINVSGSDWLRAGLLEEHLRVHERPNPIETAVDRAVALDYNRACAKDQSCVRRADAAVARARITRGHELGLR